MKSGLGCGNWTEKAGMDIENMERKPGVVILPGRFWWKDSFQESEKTFQE